MKVNERIKAIVDRMDQDLAKIRGICQKGCPYCCYQAATIADYEEVAIKNYIKKRLSRKIKSSIRQSALPWLKQYEEIYDEAERMDHSDLQKSSQVDAAYAMYQIANQNLADAQVPCPFLVDSKCAIYPARPLACRIHGQVDDLETCRTKLLREGSTEYKTVAEPYFEQIKTVLVDTIGQSSRTSAQRVQAVVYHKHLVPAVRSELMINLKMRHSPTLQFLI